MSGTTWNGVIKHEYTRSVYACIYVNCCYMDVIHDMEMERMKLSDNGLKLIKKYEGCRLKAYKATSSEKYYTIGYGHYSKDITADTVISLDKQNNF